MGMHTSLQTDPYANFIFLLFPFLVQAQAPFTQLLGVYDKDIKQLAINYLYGNDHREL